jgi:hypothetical protein
MACRAAHEALVRLRAPVVVAALLAEATSLPLFEPGARRAITCLRLLFRGGWLLPLVLALALVLVRLFFAVSASVRRRLVVVALQLFDSSISV